MNRLLKIMVFGALVAGCGVAGDDQRAQLMVVSASWMNARLASPYALTGPGNLAVTLRITNAQPTPMPLGTTHFVLGTSDGFLYRASPSTTLFPGGCSPGASVASGAQVECTVLFSLNGVAPVSQVGYEYEDKASTLVKITVAPCSYCGGQCVDLNTDPDHCGGCGKDTEGASACKAGKAVCGTGFTACGSQCVNLLTDAENCGACGRRVEGARCVSGAPTCNLPELQCGNSCTNVNDDAQNCGRCGATCPSSYACLGGQCACSPGTTICGSGCADLQTDRQNCGTCGRTCGSGQYCSSGSCYTGSSGGGGGGGGGGGCSVNCGQFGLSCCGSSCC